MKEPDEVTAVRYLMIERSQLIQLLQRARCPECDGSGQVGHLVPSPMSNEDEFEDDWEFTQCQWCHNVANFL